METNHSAGVDHSDHSEEEKKAKGIETDGETKKRAENKKPSKKPAKKPAKEKKTVAKKTPKAKKTTGERAPRIVLTEKQLAETRSETLRVRPCVMKMIDAFIKTRKDRFDTTADAVEHLIIKAYGRQAALDRYNEKNAA